MKLSRVLLVLALPFSVVAMFLMVVASSTAYQPNVSNYFERTSPLPVLSVIFVCLAIAVGIAAAIVARYRNEPFSTPATPSFALLPAATGTLASAILLFIAGKALNGILFFVEALFFALLICPFVKKYAAYAIWSGFAAIAAQVVLISTYYFDMTVEMNAPVKVLLQMGLLGAMLDCTVEIRILIGRSHALLTPILTVFAFAICLLSGFSALALTLDGKMPSMVYIAAMPALIGFATTAGYRLMQILNPFSPVSPTEQEKEENAE